MNQQPESQVKIRLPEELKQTLKIEAIRNRRSLSGEIEYRLGRSCEHHPVPSHPDSRLQ